MGAMAVSLLVSALAAPVAAVDPGCCTAPGVALAFPDNVTRLSAVCNPTGNRSPTLTALEVQGITGAAGTREFVLSVGLQSTMGSAAPSSPHRDKVALYAGVEAKPGTGDVWAMNPLVTQEPGSGSYNAQGIELDFNNYNAHRGDVAGGFGLAEPVSYGLSVTGASKFRSTSAVLVAGEKQTWNRGITFASDSVVQSSFQDVGNPQRSIDILGNPQYGVYQASTSSKNYFGGGTGVGVERPESQLDVAGRLNVQKGDITVKARTTGSDGSPPTDVYHSVSVAHGSRPVHMSGNVVLYGSGEAVVQLPASFASSVDTSSATFLLTPIGGPAPMLHVASHDGLTGQNLKDGFQFSIAGGTPGLTVSWHVSAPRADEYAANNEIQ